MQANATVGNAMRQADFNQLSGGVSKGMQGGSGGNKRGGRRQEIQNIIRRGNEPSDDMINKFISTGNNQQSSNGLSA